MPSDKNIVVIACAGSGKTTYIVKEALQIKNQKILIVTYTNENLDQIKSYFIEKAGHIPVNITIQSWFSFLLQEGVRPYQNQMGCQRRVRSIFFQVKQSPYHKKNNYFTAAHDIYSNKVSEFVYDCEKRTEGLISKRLEKIYDYIFIDELQDFAGYDLNVLEMLLDSNINLLAVGDPRQATFNTNNAPKNRQYRRNKIYEWIKRKEEEGKIIVDEMNDCYRCNQTICDFADKLFPDFPKTVSRNKKLTEHDGIFFVSTDKIEKYFITYNPKILRFWKKTDTLGYEGINIGLTKGRTYDRVLIFPTGKMLDYLNTNDISKAGDRSKLYVAVTRAKYSVAFVKEDEK